MTGDSAAQQISLGRLLAIFFKIGSVGFGGGMAIISIMERELVRERRLLPLDEFLHGVGFGQILGSFAVNTALFVGYRLFGVVGGILSAAVFMLPSIVLVIVLSDLYFRFHAIPALQGAVAGLGPVVIALLVDAAWAIGERVLRSASTIIVAALSLAGGVLKLNTLLVLLSAVGMCFLLTRGESAPGQRAPGRSGPVLAIAPVLPALGTGSLLTTIGATFLKVGLVFFGGGFLLVPVLHHRLIADLHWLTAHEFVDGVAISSLTPGPIAVLATFAGYHMAGIAGALVATVALMAPATALMLVLSRQYARMRHDRWAQRFLCGLNPAVVGLVLSTAVLLGGGVLTSWQRWSFAAVSLLVLRKLKWPPVVLLAMSAAGGYFGLL